MNIKYFFFIIIMFTIVGCVKTIANDDDRSVDFSFHEKSFGSSAQDLLKGNEYTSLKIEVQYMKGFKPDRSALNNLKSFLEKHLNKPEGIFVVTKEIKPTGKAFLYRQEVDSIRMANRTTYSTVDQLAVHILYTDGDYVNSKILAEAYRNTSIVIFGKSLKDNSGTLSKPNRTTLESTLLMHEFGHLLGLMNKGSSMYTDHKDEKNASHCENRNCLMYYGIDIEDRFGPLVKKEIPTLDEDCLFDLVANGGNN